MEIELENIKYKVIKDEKNGFDIEEVKKKYNDYFNNYDYVVGDWAYGKLRLKGFNKKSNSNFNKINDFSLVEDYIKNNCAYGCKYFIIEKIK
ncbi:MAG TPA: DUF1027 domain-containing protein [Bacilli bacterium]|nr:DUF1027 domain-containing protein [Bacilli bacterium]